MGSLFKDFFEKGKNSNQSGEIEVKGTKPDDTDEYKIRAKISGQVQGVGFRFTTVQTAKELGINGIVRNESDGSVYTEAIGSPSQIEEYINRLAKGPSPSASVSKVVVEYDDTIQSRSSFRQV